MSEPAKSMVLPESAVTYAVADPEHAVRVGASNVIRILSPSEALQALPQYPSFGMPVHSSSVRQSDRQTSIQGEALMPSRVSTETRRKSKQTKCPPDRPELDSSEEASAMTSPATAIRTEIQELIDLQIRVFSQGAPLTVFELEDYRGRAERIKSLGRKLDQIGIAAIQEVGWRRGSNANRRSKIPLIAAIKW